MTLTNDVGASRRRATSRALALGLAALLAAASLAIAPPATAADPGSAVTVKIGDAGTVTVSKTKDLADGETITVSGRLLTAGSGETYAVAQAGTNYSPAFGSLHAMYVDDSDAALGRLTADADGYSAFSIDYVVRHELTNAVTGERFDGRSHQSYLTLGASSADSTGTDGTVRHRAVVMQTANAVFSTRLVPLTFAGGASTLTVDTPVAVTAQPAPVTARAGATVTFSGAASGDPAPSLQWQVSDDNGEGWSTLEGETSAVLTRTVTVEDDGLQFRLRATNRISTAFSHAAVLSIDVPETTTPPDPEPEEPFDPTKIALTAKGSWARVTPLTGLTDGQRVRIEADYSRIGDDWHLDGTSEPYTPLPIAQIVEGSGSEGTKRAKISLLESTPAGGRYAVDGSFAVSRHLTAEDGTVTDCLVTQCYLALGGNLLDDVNYSTVWTPGEVTDAYFYPADGGATAPDNRNTRFVPVFFEGTKLVPPPVPEPPTPVVRTLPAVTKQPANVAVVAGYAAQFETTVTGAPAPALQWQRSVDGGASWQTIRGQRAASIRIPTSTELDGQQYRVRAINEVGAVYSQPATLTVTPATDDGNNPGADVSRKGISLDWVGSPELQRRSPAYTPNYYSAGVSEGSKATYKNLEGNTAIVFRAADGTERATTFETTFAHLPGSPSDPPTGDQQLVRLNNGVLTRDAVGGGSVRWDATWTINFYGGLVPFTLSNPVLTWDRTGAGTLRADLSGYGSSMENPEVKEPLTPAPNTTVATFSNARVDAQGVLHATPDYAGVTVNAPESVSPQDRTTDGWGSWPQSFVDFQFLTGLSSYWYSSGASADRYKAPSPLVISGLFDVVIGETTAPSAPAAPTLALGEGTTLTATWTAPAFDGGSAVTGYDVELRSGDRVVSSRSVETLTITFEALERGVAYTATVAARNAIGVSAPSAASAAVTVPVTQPVDPAPTAQPVLVGEFGADTGVPISVSGSTITVRAGAAHANAWIGVSVHSTAQFLGWHRADASGGLSLPLPTGLPSGTHHVAVYAADGSVLGYAAFTVAEPPVTDTSAVSTSAARGLAATGADAAGLWPLAGIGFLLLATGVVVIARRRTTMHG